MFPHSTSHLIWQIEVKCEQIYPSHRGVQARQDMQTPNVGASLLFSPIFLKNCLTMNKNGPRGKHTSLTLLTDPPMPVKFVTTCQRNCGKLMFSVKSFIHSVCLSVHRGCLLVNKFEQILSHGTTPPQPRA